MDSLGFSLQKSFFAIEMLMGLQGGGVRLNNQKVSDEQQVLSESDFIDGRLALIAAGKKNKMLLRIVR